MKKAKHITLKILNVMDAIFIIFFIYVVIMMFFVKDTSKINVFGYFPTKVTSGSMEPTIMTGDFILTKQTTFDDVRVGDIIVYHHKMNGTNEYKNIIHRIVGKKDDYLICKGDANDTIDPWLIKPEEVRSKYVFNFFRKM